MRQNDLENVTRGYVFLRFIDSCEIRALLEIRAHGNIGFVPGDWRHLQWRSQQRLDSLYFSNGFFVLDIERLMRVVYEDVRNDMDLMPQMIKRKHGLVEHENRIVHSQIIDTRLWNVFDGTDHVVTEITNCATRKGRKVRQLHRLESRHRGPQVLHEISRLSILVALHEEWIAAQKRVPRNPFTTFHTFKEESVRSILLQLQKRRNRRQEIGNDRLIDGNDVSLRLKFPDFVQVRLHTYLLLVPFVALLPFSSFAISSSATPRSTSKTIR